MFCLAMSVSNFVFWSKREPSGYDCNHVSIVRWRSVLTNNGVDKLTLSRLCKALSNSKRLFCKATLLLLYKRSLVLRATSNCMRWPLLMKPCRSKANAFFTCCCMPAKLAAATWVSCWFNCMPKYICTNSNRSMSNCCSRLMDALSALIWAIFWVLCMMPPV